MSENQKTPVQGGATEEQIEAVGQAIRAELRPERKDSGPLYLDHDVYEYENMARAAIAALSVSASADPAYEHHDAEEREAESEDHAATVTGDREKLIEEAKDRGCPYDTCECDGSLIRRLRDALAAPVEVDEAKLAEVIESSAAEWGDSARVRSVLAQYIACAVAEWLRGENC